MGRIHVVSRLAMTLTASWGNIPIYNLYHLGSHDMSISSHRCNLKCQTTDVVSRATKPR